MVATRFLFGNLAVLLLLLAAPSRAIMGGEPAARGAFPHAVYIDSPEASCGGSIIGTKHILTAAHCVEKVDPANLTVRVGSNSILSGGLIVPADKIIPHEKYDGHNNNIAIIVLRDELVPSNVIQLVALATLEEENPAADEHIKVVGWGRTNADSTNKPRLLQSKEFAVAASTECEEVFEAEDPKSVFCMKHELNEGSCNGDGGNGAVYNDVLVGVTNYVIGSCGSRYPDVFAKVSYYYDWIMQQME